MFYRDMVKRFAFRDVKEFQEAFYHILSLYGGYFTHRSLQRALKGLGVEANVKTVMNYLRAMEESFLVFQLPIFSPLDEGDYDKTKKVLLTRHLLLCSSKGKMREESWKTILF